MDHLNDLVRAQAVPKMIHSRDRFGKRAGACGGPNAAAHGWSPGSLPSPR